MKKVLFTMAMLVAASGAFAQQSVIKEAKKLMKGSFGAAETTLAPALTNPETKDLAETWDVAGNIQKNWMDNEYKKSLLNQPYDEEQMYTSALKMVQYFTKCDELAQKPDAKGKINNKFRNANAKAILENRDKLINGGIYYLKKIEGAEDKVNGNKAIQLLGGFVDLASNPMFTAENLQQTDPNFGLASFYAAASAQMIEDWENMGKYAKFAVNDSEYGLQAMQLVAESYRQQGKMDDFFNVLKEGVQKFPEEKWFFGSAVNYYTNKDDFDGALNYVNEAIAGDPNNSYKYYIKGFVYQLMKKNDDAIDAFKKSIELDPENADSWSKLGQTYVIKAQDLSETATIDMDSPQYAKDQQAILALFANAREPYEKARQLQPEDTSLWAAGLRSVYYNLHLENELKEIETLMGY